MANPPENLSTVPDERTEPPLRIYTDTSVIGGCFDQ